MKGTRMTHLRNDERGHLLIAVIVGVAVLLIFTTVALQSWGMTMARDNEDELVFRGQQMAMALKMFQKYNGRFPTDLKELEEMQGLHGYVLRRKWKDPMTESGEWGQVYMAPQGGMISSANIEQVQQETSQIGQQGPASLQTATAGLPIMGVHSLSDKEPIGPRKWRGGQKYSEWLFTANDVGQRSDVLPPGAGPQNNDDDELGSQPPPGGGGILPPGGGRGGAGGGGRLGPGGGRPPQPPRQR